MPAPHSLPRTLLTTAISFVWLINGLCCKLLNFVPRHQQIVTRILGADQSGAATKTIGILEIFMSVWILSRIRARLCAWLQVILIAVLNTIEFSQATDLLLFGRLNAVVAALFIAVILYNEYAYPLKRRLY